MRKLIFAFEFALRGTHIPEVVARFALTVLTVVIGNMLAAAGVNFRTWAIGLGLGLFIEVSLFAARLGRWWRVYRDLDQEVQGLKFGARNRGPRD